MNKKIYISAVCALALSAAAADLGTIEVVEEVNTKVVTNVSGEEVKNADLAEALAKKSPSIQLIRRSGIANDIILRGQKRDNIRVTIDGAVVCGACVNRMDPPTSHVITSNIQSVEIKEGPFDVTEMGTLSGGIKIKTKKPTKEPSGEITATVGSFGYKKGVISASGGNDTAKLMITVSKEEGDQYEDGDGNNFADQLATKSPTTKLADAYKDMKAYEKQSVMLKTIVNIDDKSDIELSFTRNESDNVIYANSKMDAIYDDSDILNFKYSIRDLGKYSKKLEVKAYHSEVDHPMSTKYRVSSGTNSANEAISALTTDVKGFKVLNTFDYLDREITYGIDTSNRNWDGTYTGYGTKVGITGRKSLDDVDTKNKAVFVQSNRTIGKTDLELGARYDKTDIDTQHATDKDRSFNSLSANIFATYNLDNDTKYFFGIGRSYRVPDARELYFNSSANKSQGTDTLEQTSNTEIDIGIQKQYEIGTVKAKAFYSKLKNYIYFNGPGTMTSTDNFENIDAAIYGAELNGAYYVNNQVTFDAAIAYKKGKKDTLPTGDTDSDLADIAPLQTTLALTYDHDDNTNASIELISSADWNNYDSDNGEQKIDGYNIVNLKGQTKLTKKVSLTVGIDNLFDKTYAVSNTYQDLTLLNDGTTGEIMLMNEPGRYFYGSVTYKF